MRVATVQPHPAFQARCYGACGRMLDSDAEPIFADLDGPAFRAYYCAKDRPDADGLHHEDGSHRTTARTANGSDVARHDANLRAHVADGHHHGPVPYALVWPDGYVHCHGDDHGHRAYGDETYENTAWHRREDSRLIEWPNGGGALWHCPRHSDHTVRDGDCR